MLGKAGGLVTTATPPLGPGPWALWSFQEGVFDPGGHGKVVTTGPRFKAETMFLSSGSQKSEIKVSPGLTVSGSCERDSTQACAAAGAPGHRGFPGAELHLSPRCAQPHGASPGPPPLFPPGRQSLGLGLAPPSVAPPSSSSCFQVRPCSGAPGRHELCGGTPSPGVPA